MAHLIQPFINAGGSPSAQEMYRSTRHSFEFIPDAFSPFGYPKRAFNDFYLRDYLNLMACLICGEVERAYSCLQIYLEI